MLGLRQKHPCSPRVGQDPREPPARSSGRAGVGTASSATALTAGRPSLHSHLHLPGQGLGSGSHHRPYSAVLLGVSGATQPLPRDRASCPAGITEPAIGSTSLCSCITMVGPPPQAGTRWARGGQEAAALFLPETPSSPGVAGCRLLGTRGWVRLFLPGVSSFPGTLRHRGRGGVGGPGLSAQWLWVLVPLPFSWESHLEMSEDGVRDQTLGI